MKSNKKNNIELLKKIIVYKGDITKMGIDVIVNAANPTLLGGGGVDGAIHAAAGPKLLEACRMLHGCSVGEAKITSGFLLPSPYIIHTVGPIWEGGLKNEHQKLALCYKNSLILALEHQLKTIAFPAISTGLYGFPKKKASTIAVNTIFDFLYNHNIFHNIYLVAFDNETEKLYKEQLLKKLRK